MIDEEKAKKNLDISFRRMKKDLDESKIDSDQNKTARIIGALFQHCKDNLGPMSRDIGVTEKELTDAMDKMLEILNPTEHYLRTKKKKIKESFEKLKQKISTHHVKGINEEYVGRTL